MKKTFLKITAAAIAFTFAPLANAQETPSEDTAAAELADSIAAAQKAANEVVTVDADPALWVVKDEDTTIYMLGTVHLLKPGLSWFDEAVKTAFDASDSVVLEIKPGNPAEDQQLFAQYAINQTGVPARSNLTEEQQKSYEKAITSLGLPLEGLDPFKPWAAGLVMQITAIQAAGFDPNSGAEKVIEAAANAAGKEIIGLETTDFQLGLFDGLSDATQKEFLVQTIESMDEIETSLDALVDAWAAGDPQKLGVLMNEGLSNAELTEKLLTNRNANWAKWIKERMDKPGTIFMAVGAGHLAGSTDVQTLLNAYGIKAQRIDY